MEGYNCFTLLHIVRNHVILVDSTLFRTFFLKGRPFTVSKNDLQRRHLVSTL
jgi:hypothetical protein